MEDYGGDASKKMRDLVKRKRNRPAPFPARRDSKVCSIFDCSNEAEKKHNVNLSIREVIARNRNPNPNLCYKLCKTCEEKFLKGANIVYCKNCYSIVQLFHFKIMRFRKGGIYYCSKCRYCEGDISDENKAKKISNQC